MGEPPARRGRDLRPVVVGLGALVAVALGSAVALGVFRDDPADDTPPPAAEGGLKVELGDVQGGDRIDPTRPLRCFAEGRFVGDLTVAQCAQRNGVAAQNLDVGLDDSGALAAVVAVPGLSTEPLGPVLAEAAAPIADAVPAPTPAAAPQSGPAGDCLRHVNGEWRNLGQGLALSTCLDVLYAGRCEPPGSASYGRWNGQTLRLVTGRIEIAQDGANFRTLAEQDPSTCAPP
ncbi:MAG: hypothetical protein M3M95_04070 [Pseudomonadota bacterium]|nr:hypothetical protein [Pseudomonadota bacterium]